MDLKVNFFVESTHVYYPWSNKKTHVSLKMKTKFRVNICKENFETAFEQILVAQKSTQKVGEVRLCLYVDKISI